MRARSAREDGRREERLSVGGLAANEGKRYWKLKTERDGELQIENNFDHGDKKLYQEEREVKHTDRKFERKISTREIKYLK